MIVGNIFGSGCRWGPKGRHVVVDYGEYLWCACCDESLKAEPEENLWWRHYRNTVDVEETG